MRTLILVFSFLFLVLMGVVGANEKNLIIQCQSSNPDLAIFKPIYNIDLVKKRAKVGASDFQVLNVNSERVILGTFNPVVETKIVIDRITGKYIEDQRFFSTNKDPEKKIRDTGFCKKVEKAF